MKKFIVTGGAGFICSHLVKKLIKVSGQNPIEAAKMGCYIFHGPFVSNFAEIYHYLKQREFSEEINYPEELANKLIKNFNNNQKVVDKEKLEELEIYSNSIFKNVINESKNYLEVYRKAESLIHNINDVDVKKLNNLFLDLDKEININLFFLIIQYQLKYLRLVFLR